ncbi:MAG: hypothetical protein HY000_34560 [Planctomycetes bacterium]|nr:hypothetical protein [Planctomycetota bacterium]
MIPQFEESGALPPGMHPATLEEVENRFGTQSELRKVQMESVKWMVDCLMLRNEREVQNTRRKLARLEALYRVRAEEKGGDHALRDATMESLKRFINQFKEEIARYEAHHAAPK